MITLLSEGHCFTTYLSLYLHRIVKFYFFCFLTFIFSFDWYFRGQKHTLGYLFNQNIEIQQKIFESPKILIILMVFAAENLTFS